MISAYCRLVLASAVLSIFPPVAQGKAETSEDRLRRDAVVEAVEKTRPAVVNINAEEESIRSNPFSGFGDSFFEEFFRDFFESSPRRRRSSRSLGSGVIIDKSGYILTNEHVVARASRIQVTLADETTFQARIVGSDPDHDLAVLKVDVTDPLPAIKVGSSDNLLIGEKVIAIGNPFGLTHTVTTGVVSATRRSIRTGQGRVYYDFIQTDAAINPGNSGGPLLDITGRLVGINTAIYAEGKGIGFAIPADIARRVVDDLVRYGEVQPVWIGTAVRQLGQRSGRDGEASAGIRISRIFPGGPGDRAGLRVDDVIAKVDDEQVRSVGEFHFRVSQYSDGELVPLRVLRGRKKVDFIVRAETPDDGTQKKISWQWLGIESEEDRYGVRVRKVRRRGPADKTGIQAGDRILEVEGEKVKELESMHRGILTASQRGKVLLLIQRGRWGYYVTLKLDD